MTDPTHLASERKFREIPVQMDGFTTKFFVNELGLHVAIITDTLEGGELRLYIKEARGIRDWLNKVLP